MARADGTIRVDITGDVDSFTKSIDKASTKIGVLAGVGSAAGTAVLSGLDRAGDALLDFAADSLQEWDRLGDATTVLQTQLGDDLAASLEAVAGSFHALGLSRADFIELAGSFADVATALGISDPLIASFADDVVKTAAAFSLISDKSPQEIVDLIGKAASGADKPLRELGVHLDDGAVAAQAMAMTGKDNAKALTDGELAAARMVLILDQLKPRYDAVTGATQDAEGKTREIQATIEDAQATIGEALEGPYLQLLIWLQDLLIGLGFAIDGLGILVQWLRDVGRVIGDVLTPLARLADLVGEVGGFLGIGGGGAGGGFGGGGGGGGKAKPVTVNINGGNPQEVERAVNAALDDLRIRNGHGPYSFD